MTLSTRDRRALVLDVLTRRPWTRIDEMAMRFSVNERTIYRDIAALRGSAPTEPRPEDCLDRARASVRHRSRPSRTALANVFEALRRLALSPDEARTRYPEVSPDHRVTAPLRIADVARVSGYSDHVTKAALAALCAADVIARWPRACRGLVTAFVLQVERVSGSRADG
ncbi:MAG: hypothetical protein KC620_12470 [Myxococcales bacterium]|nr:hypothetical protein [Myxococcales bacterium]